MKKYVLILVCTDLRQGKALLDDLHLEPMAAALGVGVEVKLANWTDDAARFVGLDRDLTAFMVHDSLEFAKNGRPPELIDHLRARYRLLANTRELIAFLTSPTLRGMTM